MGFWSTLARIGGYAAAPFTGGASIGIGNAAGSMIDSASAGLGGASQAAASNRGTKAEIMMDQNRDLERQLLEREQEKRNARSAAYRDMMVGQHVQNFAPAPRPAGLTPSYTTGASDAAKAAGMSLYDQGKARMGAADLQQNSGMPTYRNLATDKAFQKTLNPSIWEKIAGIGSAVLPMAGLIGAGRSGGSKTTSGGDYDSGQLGF